MPSDWRYPRKRIRWYAYETDVPEYRGSGADMLRCDIMPGNSPAAKARLTARNNIAFTVGEKTPVTAVSVADSIFDGVLFSPQDQDLLIKVVTAASASMMQMMSARDGSDPMAMDFDRFTVSTFDTSAIAKELMAQSVRGDSPREHHLTGWRVKVNFTASDNGTVTKVQRWCYLDPSGTSVVKYFDIPLNNL